MPRHPSRDRCQFCRRRKKKCDGQTPCHACKNPRIGCVYHMQRPNSGDVTIHPPKQHCSKPKPPKLKEPTDAIQENDGRRCKVEEESPGAVINNQTRFIAKDAIRLQTDGDININPRDPEYPVLSIESSTSQRSFSISDADDIYDSTASPRSPPYASRHMGWTEAHMLHALDNILQWDCVAFCLIDGGRFKRDLQTGSTKYCSSALVDALLALSAVVSRRDIVREVANRETETPTGDVFSANLANEAIQALHRGPWPPEAIPDIQALGVLALYCACNRWKDESLNFAMDFAEAIRKYCLRSADSSYAFPSEWRITASTYCGAISMNRVLVQIHKYDLNLPARLRETPAKYTKYYNGSTRDSESWTKHLLRATLANDLFAANSNSRGHDIYSVAAELYQLIEQVFKTCCILENVHTFADATATYVNGLEWYQKLFRYSETYTGREPLILFVHTYYHFCILTLFTPYVMEMALVTDGSPPGKICEEAADIILKLMEHRDCLAGNTEPVGLMNSFKNASLKFLDFYKNNKNMR